MPSHAVLRETHSSRSITSTSSRHLLRFRDPGQAGSDKSVRSKLGRTGGTELTVGASATSPTANGVVRSLSGLTAVSSATSVGDGTPTNRASGQKRASRVRKNKRRNLRLPASTTTSPLTSPGRALPTSKSQAAARAPPAGFSVEPGKALATLRRVVKGVGKSNESLAASALLTAQKAVANLSATKVSEYVVHLLLGSWL